MNIYHYTTEAHLPAIFESGFLKLTPQKSKLLPGERPLVWFTTLEDMPPTAIKPIRLPGVPGWVTPTVDELHELLPIWRFRLIDRAVPLWKWSKVLRNGALASLEISAKAMGEDPGTWRASPKRVKLDSVVLERRAGPYIYERSEAPVGAPAGIKIEEF